jgi:hypothetical protein
MRLSTKATSRKPVVLYVVCGDGVYTTFLDGDRGRMSVKVEEKMTNSSCLGATRKRVASLSVCSCCCCCSPIFSSSSHSFVLAALWLLSGFFELKFFLFFFTLTLRFSIRSDCKSEIGRASAHTNSRPKEEREKARSAANESLVRLECIQGPLSALPFLQKIWKFQKSAAKKKDG